MLATRRDTSHSNGPGRVSSKWRRSNDSWRSGVAQLPKLRTWASPHSCTVKPVPGREARSAPSPLPRRGRTPTESPPSGNGGGEELRQPDRVLSRDQRQRVGLVRPLPSGELGPLDLFARGATGRTPLGSAGHPRVD